jgi:hypothetical protein
VRTAKDGKGDCVDKSKDKAEGRHEHPFIFIRRFRKSKAFDFEDSPEVSFYDRGSCRIRKAVQDYRAKQPWHRNANDDEAARERGGRLRIHGELL